MTVRNEAIHGPSLAVLSVILFGISPVLCKLLIGDMSPVLLAGLLYLGSGIGLSFVLAGKQIHLLREALGISSSHRLKLLGAVFSGGIIAPCVPRPPDAFVRLQK